MSKANFFSLWCQLSKRNEETLLPGNAARLVANTVASARHLEDIGDDPQHLVIPSQINRKKLKFFFYLCIMIFTSIASPSHPLVSRGIKDKVKKYQPPHSVSRSGIWTQQQPKKWHFSETKESSVRPSSSVVNLSSTSLSRKGLHRPATNLFAAHHQDARHRLCESQLCTCCILMTWPKAATWCYVRRVRRRPAKISRTIARRLSWSSKWFCTGSNSW